MEEKVIKKVYKFYDRDENCFTVADQKEVDRIMKGGRIPFSERVKTPHHITYKTLRRRPARVEVISTIERVQRFQFFTP